MAIEIDGVSLPDIPSDVFTYPYRIIFKIEYNNETSYYIIGIQEMFIFLSRDTLLSAMGNDYDSSDGALLKSNTIADCVCYEYIDGSKYWEAASYDMTYVPIGQYEGRYNYQLLLSNDDIYEYVYINGKPTKGTIYFTKYNAIITSDKHYKSIASKVREILGNDTTYKPRELPDAIRSTSDILNPYDVKTGLVYRKDGAKVAGGILYPGLYTRDNCAEIVLPDNITEIAPYGLQYLSIYINKLICNEGLTKIGYMAASMTFMLKELKLPKSLISIGDGAFYGSGITSLELPDNLTSIGYLTFGGCKMTSLTIPKSVKTINLDAFASCKELVEVNILSDQSSEIQTCFTNCTSLKRVDFKGNISKLSFSGWFSGCTALEAVILRGSFCSLSTNAFSNTTISSGTGYIYVPSSLLDKYKTATYWSTYASQIRAIEDYPEICDPTE